MQFGTFLLMQSPSMRPSEEIYRRAVEITQAADEPGFQNMWLAEHHFSNYGYSSRPLQTVVHLADKTERIRVGIAVIILPFHQPLIVAEEIATADVLTGGRLDVGRGRGYQPYEFDRLGLTIEQSRDRWGEAFQMGEAAEGLGCDSIWLAERHFAAPGRPLDAFGAGVPSMAAAPLILASAIAARTQRLRIGIAQGYPSFQAELANGQSREDDASWRWHAACRYRVGGMGHATRGLALEPPAAQILHTPHTIQVDLIVLGAHVKGKPEHRLLGDTVARVVGQPPCPVTSVPPVRA